MQYPGTKGVLPGYGHQNPNDWGLGFEIRDCKSPHWTGGSSSPRTFGHFGQSGTFLWIDPDAGRRGAACVALTDRAFGPWAVEAWPAFTDAVLAELATGSARAYGGRSPSAISQISSSAPSPGPPPPGPSRP